MILDLLGLFVLADIAAAIALATIIYIAGRKSLEPVSIRSAIVVALFLGLPAVVLYGVVWMCLSRG